MLIKNDVDFEMLFLAMIVCVRELADEHLTARALSLLLLHEAEKEL